MLPLSFSHTHSSSYFVWFFHHHNYEPDHYHSASYSPAQPTLWFVAAVVSGFEFFVGSSCSHYLLIMHVGGRRPLLGWSKCGLAMLPFEHIHFLAPVFPKLTLSIYGKSTMLAYWLDGTNWRRLLFWLGNFQFYISSTFFFHSLSMCFMSVRQTTLW